MLRPSGVLIASGPAYQFLFAHQDRVTHHMRRYTLTEMKAKMREAGFEILKASYINVILFPLILPAVLTLKLWQTIRPPDDTTAGSNVGIPIPRWTHDVLTGIFSSEAQLLKFLSAPAGHSLVVVARKPA
jgi:hypothetical protein